jgi:hypothetical protein
VVKVDIMKLPLIIHRFAAAYGAGATATRNGLWPLAPFTDLALTDD